MLRGFSTTVDEDEAKSFTVTPKKAKKPRKEPKPEKIPSAWRDPYTGHLWIDIPFDPGFNTAMKTSVPGPLRQWSEIDGVGFWKVDREYALMVEDLLEMYWPDILIDYKGWNPAHDHLDVDFEAVPDDPPPF